MTTSTTRKFLWTALAVAALLACGDSGETKPEPPKPASAPAPAPEPAPAPTPAPAPEPTPEPTGGTAPAAGDAAAGKIVYDANCLTCHGPTGGGDGPVGAALQPPPRNFAAADFAFDTDGDGAKGTDADLKNVITKGGMAFGGTPLMAPWPMLSAADVDNLVAYIRTLKQ
jgi:mono/diheme cytochrome c family protein